MIKRALARKAAKGCDYYEIMLGGPIRSVPGGIVWTGERALNGFNEYRFHEGKPIEDWTDGVTFVVRGHVEEDYIFLTFHWRIVHERVRRVLQECQVKGVQFLPIRVIQQDSGKELGPYWAMNVFQEVDALDWDRTVWPLSKGNPREHPHPEIGIIRPVLCREPLNGLDIFRLNIKGKGDTSVYISARVKECLERARATSGFKFRPVEAY